MQRTINRIPPIRYMLFTHTYRFSANSQGMMAFRILTFAGTENVMVSGDKGGNE
jgi:hypothetical protein